MHQAQCQQKIDLKVVYTVAHCNRNCWKRTIPHCKMHNSRIRLLLLQQREFLLNKACDVKALFVSPLTSIQLAPSCSGLLSLHISARLCGVFASVQLTIGFDRPDRAKLDTNLGGDESGFSLLPEYSCFQQKTCQIQSDFNFMPVQQ